MQDQKRKGTWSGAFPFSWQSAMRRSAQKAAQCARPVSVKSSQIFETNCTTSDTMPCFQGSAPGFRSPKPFLRALGAQTKCHTQFLAYAGLFLCSATSTCATTKAPLPLKEADRRAWQSLPVQKCPQPYPSGCTDGNKSSNMQHACAIHSCVSLGPNIQL